MRPHKKLIAWQESIKLVVEIYTLTQSLPKEEKYGLISQMKRAAVSITANIAEGATRISDKEKIRFYNMAEGSASELDTYLELCPLLNLISANLCLSTNNTLEKVCALVAGLIKSIENRMDKGKK